VYAVLFMHDIYTFYFLFKEHTTRLDMLLNLEFYSTVSSQPAFGNLRFQPIKVSIRTSSQLLLGIIDARISLQWRELSVIQPYTLVAKMSVLTCWVISIGCTPRVSEDTLTVQSTLPTVEHHRG
jgi:hypothetical protein